MGAGASIDFMDGACSGFSSEKYCSCFRYRAWPAALSTRVIEFRRQLLTTVSTALLEVSQVIRLAELTIETM
jgi:hypothetical protein